MRRCAAPVVFVIYALLPVAGIGAIQPYIELTQMLSVEIGADVSIGPRSGLRADIGASPLGPTCITYGLTGYRRLRAPQRPFQIDLELGMPLAYVDPFEETVVDWSDTIDSPFAGWLFGGSFVWGYRRLPRQYSIVTGYAAWWEWQADDGWKGPGGIFIVSLRFAWGIDADGAHE
jgi:hypothetical protein